MYLKVIFQEADTGMRAIDALRAHYAFSNRRCKNIKFHGYFKLNGQACRMIEKVQAGDIAEMDDDPAESSSALPLKLGAADYIIKQDKWYLACNKPANMLTHPNFWEKEAALTGKLSAEEVHLVNRLDKDSSGLVLVATTAHAHSIFSRMNLDKYYLLIAHGRVEAENHGEIYLTEQAADVAAKELDKFAGNGVANYIAYPLCRREGSILERRISKEHGKDCLTLFKKLLYDPESNCSLVLCKLLSGRTHQLRLHFLSIGHPLVGETLYDLNALAEYAGVKLADRKVSFKVEVTEEERLELDNLRFTDNPISQEVYRAALAALFPESDNIDIGDPVSILASATYKKIQALNAEIGRQALHSWAIRFLHPQYYPQFVADTQHEVIFADLPADIHAFLCRHFPQAEATLAVCAEQLRSN